MEGSVSPDGKWLWDGEKWTPNIEQNTRNISDSVININVENKMSEVQTPTTVLTNNETTEVHLSVFTPGIKFAGYSFLAGVCLGIVSSFVSFESALSGLSESIAITNDDVTEVLREVAGVVGIIVEVINPVLALAIIAIGVFSITNSNSNQLWKFVAVIIPIALIGKLVIFVLDILIYTDDAWVAGPNPYPLLYAIVILTLYNQNKPTSQ